MMKKPMSYLLICLLTFIVSTQCSFASECGDNSITINREINHYLFIEGPVTEDLISLYEDCGWSFSPDENAFYRSVEYDNEPIVIDGEDFDVENDGNVEIEKEELEDSSSVEIESITGDKTITLDIENTDELTITENVCINSVMEDMDSIIINEETSDRIDASDDTENEETNAIDYDVEGLENFDEMEGEVQTKDQKKGQIDGEKPKKGDIVSCNRFNGYQGDGKYYSNQASAKAIKNFCNSDCDWALFRSNECLKDYNGEASKRYCSLHSSSHYGKCSKIVKNGYSHSNKYHMHSSIKH